MKVEKVTEEVIVPEVKDRAVKMHVDKIVPQVHTVGNVIEISQPEVVKVPVTEVVKQIEQIAVPLEQIKFKEIPMV